MEKVLSVSVAAYNVEKYILECLEPFCNHKYDGVVEVFVIDDGGTDGTLKKAQDLAREFPEIIIPVHKENGGWGSTVNYGIQNATGKYFKQLDGDDYFDAGGLEHLIDVLKNSETDVVFSMMRTFEDETNKVVGGVTSLDAISYLKTYSLNRTIKYTPLNMHCFSFKTSILKENNVNLIRKCFYTDVEFVIKSLFGASSIMYISDCVYCYRIGREGQSVSKKSMIKHYSEHKEVIFETIRYWKTHNCNDNVSKATKKRIKQMIASQYCIFLSMPISMRPRYLMKCFDDELKVYKEFYKTSLNKVQLIRNTHFIMYYPISIYYKVKGD